MGNMDYVFSVTDQSSGTVTLTASPWSYYGGGVVTAPRDAQTVTETMEFRLMDGAGTANLDELHTLNRLLRQAEEAQRNRAISPVYLTWQTGGSAEVWRSEITQARAEPRADALSRGYWANDTMFTQVFVERKNYWEGLEAQLALTNSNGTANTDGLTVFGCSDNAGTAPNKRVNWVSIDGAAVTGDLPGATRIEITNTFNHADAVGAVWISQNAYSDPANFAHILEAEDSTIAGTDVTSGATVSGTKYRYVTISGGPTSEYNVFSWTLPQALLNCTRGNPVRILAKSPFLVWYRVQLISDSQALFDSGLRYHTPVTDTEELCTMRLPPRNLGDADMQPITLLIKVKPTMTSTSHEFNLDFIQLSPLDGWRYINGAFHYQSRLVDDGIEGYTYADGGALTGRSGHFQARGNPIQLYPGRDQRLYFLPGNTGMLATTRVDRTMSIKVFYRPRRVTL
jgi:hypothetical protein